MLERLGSWIVKWVLVELLVATAESDTTNPPVWLTDLLLQAIERLIIRKEKRYQLFAEIAAEAALRVKDPHNVELLQQAVLNGTRRRDDVDPTVVQALIAERSRAIRALEAGLLRERLQGFFDYQVSTVGAQIGSYLPAAAAVARLAGKETSTSKKAMYLYLERVYTMWNSLMGEPGSLPKVALHSLREQLPLLQRDVAGSDLEVSWGKGNGPCDLLLAMVLADDRTLPIWDMQMEALRRDATLLGAAFREKIAALEAAYAFVKGNYDNAVGLAVNVVDSDALPYVKMAARLVHARALRDVGHGSRAQVAYMDIVPVPDGHMIVAVAKSELEGLAEREPPTGD